METIKIILDHKPLQAADQVARRTGQNLSALVCDARQELPQRLEVLAREERDREGYAQQPQTHDESRPWEAESVI
jgi:hypothetical protein